MHEFLAEPQQTFAGDISNPLFSQQGETLCFLLSYFCCSTWIIGCMLWVHTCYHSLAPSGTALAQPLRCRALCSHQAAGCHASPATFKNKWLANQHASTCLRQGSWNGSCSSLLAWACCM